MSSSDVGAGARWYNAVWRWHFYAGLCCIPFVVWLALTGSIYLWRPQIEAWLDRPYDHLAAQGPIAAPEAQVAAALKAVPGGALHRYVLPQREDEAVRILVAKSGADWRVMVDPRTLAVLDARPEETRPMRLLFHLHGELLSGAIGSYVVETAACWSVVMLLTGLYLWWPRGRTRLAGVLYPRLESGSRIFWRDLHATAGFWVSIFALGLILTGLPWAKGWGGYLAEIRNLTGTTHGPVDWSIGGKPPKDDAITGEHAGHHAAGAGRPPDPGELARVIAAVGPLGVAPPVLLSPPVRDGEPWRVQSDTADRPLRSEAKIDGATGKVLSVTPFAQRHWIDRAVGYGVAAHEGALFGLANQLLGTATALLLVVLALSGAVMWWRRRPAGILGAPRNRGRSRPGPALIVVILLLALYMPAFGASLALLVLVDVAILRHLPRVRRWLGLDGLRRNSDVV